MALVVEKDLIALPPFLRSEIKRVCRMRRGGESSVGEIHLSVGKRSSVLSHGERIYLSSRVTEDDMRVVFDGICGGALYVHRDTIKDGYVSLGGGIRVGVCGRARYESGRLVGVSEVTSLVFRIPSAESSVTDELLSLWEGAERGMLIYAPPGGGKTTALRSLVSRIGRSRRVAVVDERCEFIAEECAEWGIDLLRGYKRADGVEIALRTLAPEVIAVDEIGARQESEAVVDSLNSGIRILATAHASSEEEVKRRGSLAPFFKYGIFDVLVGIFNTDGVYRVKSVKI